MEIAKTNDSCGCSVLRGSQHGEKSMVSGVYDVKCIDKDGNLKWHDTIDNVVTNLGANLLLSNLFGTPGTFTAYLGLISAVTYTTGPAVGDTIGTHGGWTEAGDSTNLPEWSTPTSNARATCVWNTAGTPTVRSINLSSALSFILSNGTDVVIKGCFIVTGTSASATHGDTGGVLYSAGTFTGGDKTASALDTLQVSYATTLS